MLSFQFPKESAGLISMTTNLDAENKTRNESNLFHKHNPTNQTNLPKSKLITPRN